MQFNCLRFFTKTIALFLTVLFISGCIPSEAQIENQIEAQNEYAFSEWKRKRDSGEVDETKLTGDLTIDDAIKLALQYNKKLQSALQNKEIAQGQVIESYNVILPNVSVTGGYNRQEKERKQRISGTSNLEQYSTNIRVQQPIFKGGYIPATLKTSRLLSALANEQIRTQVQELIYNVALAYYDVLLSQHLLETNREAVISAESQLRVITERRKQETATDYDVLRAQVDVANYRSEMIQQKNAIDDATTTLFKIMGISQDSQVVFVTKLEFNAMRPVFERAVEIASGLRPDLRTAEINIRVGEEAITIAKSEFWPSINGYFSQGWGKPNSTGNNKWGRSQWSAGVEANWNVFDIGSYGRLKQSNAKSEQARLDLLDTKEKVLQEIRQAMNLLSNAEEMVNALVVTQEAAKEALRLVEASYNAGVKTETDVTDARKALTDVMGNYYKALYSHSKARINLQLATGMLGPRRASDGIPKESPVPIATIEEFIPEGTDISPNKASVISEPLDSNRTSMQIKSEDIINFGSNNNTKLENLNMSEVVAQDIYSKSSLSISAKENLNLPPSSNQDTHITQKTNMFKITVNTNSNNNVAKSKLLDEMVPVAVK